MIIIDDITICYKVLLTVYVSTLTYWSFHFFICFVRFFMRRESVIRSVVIIPRFWTVWITAYVYTKERYRPRQDSNPVPSGSESTTLPMSYPGAVILYTWLCFLRQSEYWCPQNFPRPSLRGLPHRGRAGGVLSHADVPCFWDSISLEHVHSKSPYSLSVNDNSINI